MDLSGLTPKDWATLGLAAIGAILGIRSEIRALRGETVRFRVTPKVAYPVGSLPTDPRIAIEVINEGKFPITIDEVGFEVHGTRNRFAVTLPIIGDGKPWPRRLEPHDAVITYLLADDRFTAVVRRIKRAYASTSTGVTRFGHSPAMRKVVATGSIPPFPRTRSTSGQPGYVNVSDIDE